MTQQLALSVQLRDDATFDNFYPAQNKAIVTFLQQFATHEILDNDLNFIYLWGMNSSGRSHLLQACCHQIRQQNLTAFYLPLRDHKQWSSEILQDLENFSLLAIDDVHVIAGNWVWEEALFHCYNRLQQAQTRLIISGNAAPASLLLKLPDLKSRVGAGITFQLQALSDEDKLAALQLRARLRGMLLPVEAGQYLLRHYARDLNKLFVLLDELDRATLAAKSRLTVPFIKNFLLL